jgi:UDP-glucose 4-epimerase
MHDGETRIFNIGAGLGHSLNDIIGIIENIIQQPLKVRYTPGRPFDVPVNVLDISRAKTFLNWQPTIGLAEGIAYTYEWMLKETKK